MRRDPKPGTDERARARRSARCKERYANDPVFRARRKAAWREYRKRQKAGLEKIRVREAHICNHCCGFSEELTRFRGANLCRRCLCPDYDTREEATVAGTIVLWYAVSRCQSRQKAAPRPQKKGA